MSMYIWFGCAVAVCQASFRSQFCLSTVWASRSNSGHQGWLQAPFPTERFASAEYLTFKFLPTHVAQIPLHYRLGAINCRHFFLRVLEDQSADKVPSPLLFTFIYFVCV